ncbi:hypothetical protein QYM36_005756 [Artemia franciscana]|uniref:Uncharacterized protein n=1 Tax=Artemia franciscana TaxID=6661 RepID=A0AA88HUY4_ARTSF|nr:hypothetical protein QYM36_005756 [Artemia franciscana]
MVSLQLTMVYTMVSMVSIPYGIDMAVWYLYHTDYGQPAADYGLYYGQYGIYTIWYRYGRMVHMAVWYLSHTDYGQPAADY